MRELVAQALVAVDDNDSVVAVESCLHTRVVLINNCLGLAKWQLKTASARRSDDDANVSLDVRPSRAWRDQRARSTQND
jgi:hypothetical protein